MAPPTPPRSDIQVMKRRQQDLPSRTSSFRSTGSIKERLFSGVLGSWRKRSSEKPSSAMASSYRSSFDAAPSRSATPHLSSIGASEYATTQSSPRYPPTEAHYPLPTFDSQSAPPQDQRHLHAGLEMLADVQTVSAAESRDVWVAVKVEPAMPAGCADLESECFPLDIVVVVDSASFTTQRMLDALSNAVQEIYRSLDQPNDRLAVLNTHASSASVGKGKKTSRHSDYMSSPKQSTVQNALARVRSASSRRSATDVGGILSKTIEAALELVRSKHGDRGDAQTSFYHVVVISSNAQLVPLESFKDEPIHVMNPSILHTPQHETPFISGWALSSSCLHSDSYSLQNGFDHLSAFFGAARQGLGLARIENLIIDVKPLTGYPIRGILGQSREIRALVPGERAVVMLRIRVPAWNDPELIRGRPPSEKEMHVLEADLDVAVSDLFSVRLSYQQRGPSSLKHCARNCVFHLNRPNPASRWAGPSPQHPTPTFPLQPEQQLSRVQKGLAACIASFVARPVGLALVRALLIEQDCTEEVRLKLQALSEEIEILPPGSLPWSQEDVQVPDRFKWVLNSERRFLGSSFHLVHEELSSLRPESPDSSKTILRRADKTLPAIPMEEEITLAALRKENHSPRGDDGPLASALTVASTGKPRRPSADEAQGIWRALRREQRLHRDKVDGADEDETMHGDSADGQFHELRRLALRNQRSVGTDTLRSLSEGNPPTSPVGPWLY